MAQISGRPVVRSRAATAEAIPTPPNMNMLSVGPTQIDGSTGRYQRCGLWVARRSKNSLSMAPESASAGAMQAPRRVRGALTKHTLNGNSDTDP